VFWQLMDDEFGSAYARSVASDQALSPLGGLTVDQALAGGHPPREVWQAVCVAMQVPPERRLGREPAPRARRGEAAR
jgi:hypothetical protein